MRLLMLLTLTVLLSGCETIKLALTSKIPASTEQNEVGLLEVPRQGSQAFPWGKAIPKVMADGCSQDEASQLTEAIWAPIAAKIVIDKISNTVSNYVKRAKAASSQSFAFRAVIQSDVIRNGSCLVLYRGALVHAGEDKPDTPAEPSALVILKTKTYGHNAYQFTPIYAHVQKSISTTECTGNCSKPDQAVGKVNLAVAISASAPMMTVLKDLEIKQLGTATTTVKRLFLREERKSTAGIGQPSALLALPPKGVFIELSVAMTELGDIGGDPDVALGEIQAATAALSEGTLAEIKAHYDRKAAD